MTRRVGYLYASPREPQPGATSDRQYRVTTTRNGHADEYIGTVSREGNHYLNGWSAFTAEGRFVSEQRTRWEAAMALESFVTSPLRGAK